MTDTPKTRDEVEKLMRNVQSRLIHGGHPVTKHVSYMLNALEDAGLALVPEKATEEMIAESYKRTLHDPNVPYSKVINAANAAGRIRRTE